MGVFIKGMEMPKNCWECSLSDIDDDYGRCCLFSGIACLNIGRQDNCPLIEVPTPHGRLIDAEEALKRVRAREHGICTDGVDVGFNLGIDCAFNLLKAQNTIIEAEGSEE